MASDAVAGVGTLFRRWSGSAWVNVAEVNSITGPSMSRETIDVTSLDSTGGYREFIASFRDAGTIVLNMNFTRTNYETMKDDFDSEDLQQYEILLPDSENTSFEFTGLVTELPLTIAVGDKVSMDTTIKISGEPTLDSGSGS
jgi:predicted secreted protein